MPAESPDDVWNEFIACMHDLAGAHGLAVMGVHRIEGSIPDISELPPDKDEDSKFFIANSDPSMKGAFVYQNWKIDEMPDKLSPNGPVIKALGQQWLVMVYAEWDEHFRERLARAEGIEKNEIQDPVFGDLRLIRHDIIHCRGMATAEHSGKCQVLTDWMEIGKPIHIMPLHVAILMEYLGQVESPPSDSVQPWRVRELS